MKLRELFAPLVLVLAAATMQAARPRPIAAQGIERPVAFDSAGRILVLTPSLVDRLKVGSTLAIDSTNEWHEVRLFQSSDSSFVLVIQRADGAVERRTYSRAMRDALRTAIDAASAQSGMPVQETGTANVVTESARGRFVVQQSLLGLFIYGPAIGVATESAVASVAASGLTFFVASQATRDMRITAPMASASTDFAFRGAIVGLLAASGTDPGLQGGAAMVAAGSIGGALIGLNVSDQWTNAEAEAAGWGSTTLALTTLGAIGATADSDATKFFDGARPWVLAASVIGGVPLGLHYVRSAPYALTNGDLLAMRVPQFLGAALFGSVAATAGSGPHLGFALATTGFVVGAVAGDRLLARPFDHTVGEATLLGVGAWAGYIVASLPWASNNSPPAAATIVQTLGAIGGAWIAHNAFTPKAARATTGLGMNPSRNTPRELSRGEVGVHFDPMAALLAYQRTPGRHAILSISF